MSIYYRFFACPSFFGCLFVISDMIYVIWIVLYQIKDMIYFKWTSINIRYIICYMNCEKYKIWTVLYELCYIIHYICYMNVEVYKIWYMLHKLCYINFVESDMIYVIWTVLYLIWYMLNELCYIRYNIF